MTARPARTLARRCQAAVLGAHHAIAAIAATSTILLLPAAAGAAVFFPTKTADSADGSCAADCSLREAVIAANAAPGADVILLDDETYVLSRAGAGEDFADTGDLDVRDDLIVIGVAADRTAIRGAELDRVFDVTAGTRLELQNLSIREGAADGDGGGIRNAGVLDLRRSAVSFNRASGDGGGIASAATLAIAESTVAGNQAGADGGGLAAGDSAALTNVTVSGNRAGAHGGGLFFEGDTDAPVLHATITLNEAGQRGGGVYGVSQPFQASHAPTLRNSLIADNSAPLDPDCAQAVASGGHNLLGNGDGCIDFTAAKSDQKGTAAAPLGAGLSALGSHGGPTETHALAGNSAARNQGTDCAATDQRGQPRDAACDLGAFETGGACLPSIAALCANDNRFRLSATWRTPQGQTGTGQAITLTEDSGYFWFFDSDNVEVTAKVLNGCGVNGRYWVFLSGLTNVEVTVTATDTASGQTKTYTNPLNQVFRSQLDTNAFATCP